MENAEKTIWYFDPNKTTNSWKNTRTNSQFGGRGLQTDLDFLLQWPTLATEVTGFNRMKSVW